MARLSVLKTQRSHSRLQVRQQHYGLLMTDNFFDIFIVIKKIEEFYVISKLFTKVLEILL